MGGGGRRGGSVPREPQKVAGALGHPQTRAVGNPKSLRRVRPSRDRWSRRQVFLGACRLAFRVSGRVTDAPLGPFLWEPQGRAGKGLSLR